VIVAFNEVPAKAAANAAPHAVRTLSALLLRAAESAEKGTRVWGSVFQWSDPEFTLELRSIAEARELRLRIVAGDRDHEYGSEVADFFRSCVEQGGVFRARPLGRRRNHDKWFLFDRLDFRQLRKRLPKGARVVGELPAHGRALYVSTANLTVADRCKNNASILIPVDQRLALPLIQRFAQLRWLYRLPSFLIPLGELLFDRSLGVTRVEDERFVLDLFPRRPASDPIRSLIDSIRPGAGPTHLRICSIRWTRSAVARALLALRRAAPDSTAIEIIARSPDDWVDLDEDGRFERQEMSAEIAETLGQCASRYWQRHERDPHSGRIRTVPGLHRDGRSLDVPLCLASIHGKYLLAEAAFADGERSQTRRVVLIGSPNMTQAALSESFEILIELKDEAGAYAAFLDNFERLKRDAAQGGLGATDSELAVITAS
jgi:hypothetical protein